MSSQNKTTNSGKGKPRTGPLRKARSRISNPSPGPDRYSNYGEDEGVAIQTLELSQAALQVKAKGALQDVDLESQDDGESSAPNTSFQTILRPSNRVSFIDPQQDPQPRTNSLASLLPEEHEGGKTQNPLVVGGTSLYEDSDNESLDDFDMFSMDKAVSRLTKEKWDHRFHRAFAFILHLMSFIVTVFSFEFALDPKVQHEYHFRLMSPLSLLSLILIMLGTDELRVDAHNNTAKNLYSFMKALTSSPNLLYTVISIVIQRTNIMVGHLKTSNILYISDIILLLGTIVIGRILYRQRVVMGHTIGDDVKRELQGFTQDKNEGDGQNNKSFNHSATSQNLHAKNFRDLRLKESEFKDLILTELPKTGLVTFITVSYFLVESYGCLENEGMPEHGMTYCYELTGDELIEKCGNNNCVKDGGYGKCEDIINSTQYFALFFVVYAALRLYVQPLAELRYTMRHILRFDMLFRDQMLLFFFGLAAILSLYIFASSEGIDDWCTYINPIGSKGGRLVAGKTSKAFRQVFMAPLLAMYVLVFLALGLPKIPSDSTLLGRVVLRLHILIKTNEDCSLAPLIRFVLALASLVSVIATIYFVYFANMVVQEGRIWVRMAENSFAISFSLWAIQPFSVGLFFFSRPLEKELFKYVVYALLPLNSALTAMGCRFMHLGDKNGDWTENSTMDLGLTKYEACFYFNLAVFALLVFVLLPFIHVSKALLATFPAEVVNGHLVTLLSYLTTVVAPALFLFAESVANFTVELQLILSFVFLLVFGYTFSSITIRDILDFDVPMSILLQFFLFFWSTVVSFAVFGMRPRDVPKDDQKYSGLDLPPFHQDPAASFFAGAQNFIIVCWTINFVIQGMHVLRLRNRGIAAGERGRQGGGGGGTAFERLVLQRLRDFFSVAGEHTTRLSSFFLGQALIVCLFPVIASVFALAHAIKDNENASGRWHAACTSITDPAYAFLGMFIYVAPMIFGAAMSNGATRTKYFILAAMVAIGCAYMLKAKEVLIKNITHLELKKHMLTMTWVLFSQLAPVITLSSEYYGCTVRAEALSAMDNSTVFSTVSLDKGYYCGKNRSGTRAVSIQIVMMLLAAWANGVFAKYGDEKDEIRIEKVAKLDMNRYHVFQFASFLYTSFVALYLFGTRGESTNPLAKEEDGDIALSSFCSMSCRWNLLMTIYLGWFVMFVTDIRRRISSTVEDKDFVKDLNIERVNDKAKSRKSEYKKRMTVKRVWGLNEGLSQEIDKATKNKSKIEAASTERFKRAKTRKTVKAFDMDFSPGML